ncbi:MAG: deoxyribodipyrimidine photo-lyase [Aquisalimonadaceae bacterium]
MKPQIVWFRRDLRLADNPALVHATRSGPVIPVYLFAPGEDGVWAPGGASRWWLHHSLLALKHTLEERGLRLIIREGTDSLSMLRELVSETDAAGVAWNRLYDPLATARDRIIKRTLRADGMTADSFNAALLQEPWAVTKKDGGPYRAFTPFWRVLRASGIDEPPQPPPGRLNGPEHWPAGLEPDALGLLPSIPWDRGFHAHWTPGEPGATARLEHFLEHALTDYGRRRDLPAEAGTSGLSPHLHLGEISPRQIVAAVNTHRQQYRIPEQDVEDFLAELGWREFAHHLLYHQPDMPERPLDARFEHFPWSDNSEPLLRAWQQGRTGIPLVDAGMRELWSTGWMHNRVRMVVGSLLTKNLRIPWQTGEAWFWDTLVDADLASNSMGWQWIQGCGADAAPYFRIFNPVRQGERFDPDGSYVRRWVPELAKLPAKHIHTPWSAPQAVLDAAGVRLGDAYPAPIVDLASSRNDALEAYRVIRNG